uniref:F-box protein n=1 Tax=Noccaea caerulescens TaxID=107243 RepID=A0A1J3CI95_NOCCA
MVSDLPRDLSEEVLSRIPWTCVRKVRSTCKKWNTLSKNRFVAKKHLGREAEKAKEFMVVVMMDYSVYLMGVNLSNKDVESCSLKLQGKLTCPTDSDSDQIDVCKVFHCDGLLLCVPKDHTRLVVWNPYCGKPLWIEAPHRLERDTRYLYAIGYDKSSNSHKILRFRECHSSGVSGDFTIYDLGSSWRDLDITPRDWRVEHIHSGVSVNGNAYWLATEDETGLDEFGKTFLVGFDFTRETFGPPLPLPFEHVFVDVDTVSLSVVRGREKLAVLFQPCDNLKVEIWVTSKIEPDAVTWESKVFLEVSLRQTIHPMFQFFIRGATFFIDEEKKVAIVIDKELDPKTQPKRNTAYIIGVDGSLKKVDLGESSHKRNIPLACSYLPSLIQPN